MSRRHPANAAKPAVVDVIDGLPSRLDRAALLVTFHIFVLAQNSLNAEAVAGGGAD